MNLHSELKTRFGYSSFRAGQEELARALLCGRDALGVLPTGGGKSLCFQLPALLSPGTAVVVSPLIALMKDQVDRLRAAGIGAHCVHSAMGAVERQVVVLKLEECTNEEIAERLGSSERTVRRILKRVQSQLTRALEGG